MAEQQLPSIEEVFIWMRKLYDESYSGLTRLEKREGTYRPVRNPKVSCVPTSAAACALP